MKRFCGFSRRSSAFAAGAVVAVLSGCSNAPSLPPLYDGATGDYRLGAGDQVRVITYDEPQLSNTFVVGEDGTIAFPLVGMVHVAGLEVPALATVLADRLREKGLLTHPSVSAEVSVYRPVFVLGEVAHPGQYPYQPGMNMLTAAALAGGFTYRAVKDHAGVVRRGAGEGAASVEGRVGRGSPLEPGDVVTIYERYF